MNVLARALGLVVMLAPTDGRGPSPAAAQTANQHWQLAVGNYALSALAQFAGKVVRGQNVGHSARRAAVEALGPAGLQHAGMTLVGKNWRLALPAQAMVQKSAMLQRRSMLGQPLFADFWTSWELDYLWFNLRLDRGKPRLPRLNLVTVRQSLMSQPTPTRFAWGQSLVTGVPTRMADRLLEDAWGLEAGQQVILNRHVMDGTWTNREESEAVYRHELVHAMQAIRSLALVDVVLHQDASQRRPFELLRYNSDILALHLTSAQAFLANGGRVPDHDLRFIEWEADAYSGRSTQPFRWR